MVGESKCEGRAKELMGNQEVNKGTRKGTMMK